MKIRVLKNVQLRDKMWEKWMAAVCKPFTLAKLRYFEASELEAAKAWLAEA